MQFHLVKLAFHSPLHLSKGSSDYTDIEEVLHSDTVKNALFVSARRLFGEIINEEFFNKFLISSAFPFYQDEYFFPKSFLKLPLKIKGKDGHEAKKFKRLQWLGQSLFEHVINNEQKQVEEESFSGDGKFLSEKSLPQSWFVYKTEEQQRVKIIYDSDALPFYTMRLHFHKDAGLYILIVSEDEFLEKILLPSLKLLGDNGLGSYKFLGNGQFSISDAQLFQLRTPEIADHQLCLSLFCPSKEEINNQNIGSASYQLIKRGGYLANPEELAKMSWRKKSVYMFAEGSVFRNHLRLKGKLADVTPDGLSHPVYRDGQAIFISVIKQQ